MRLGHSIQEMRAIARGRGGTCLSERYETLREKLTWMCSQGHVWTAIAGNGRLHPRMCAEPGSGRAHGARDALSTIDNFSNGSRWTTFRRLHLGTVDAACPKSTLAPKLNWCGNAKKDTAGRPTLLRYDEVRGAQYVLETSGLHLSAFNNWRRSMGVRVSRSNT